MSDDNHSQKGESEIRAEVLSKFGLKEEEQKELVDKLVARELEHEKEFSTVLRQKQDNRSEKEKYETMLKDAGIDLTTGKRPEEPKIIPGEDIEKRINAFILDQLSVPESVRKDAETLAKAKGVKIEEILKDDYIQFKISKAREEEESKRASLGRDGGTGTPSVDLTKTTPKDGVFDPSSPEGRKHWDEYKRRLKS